MTITHPDQIAKTREFDAPGVMFPKGAHQLVAFCYSMEEKMDDLLATEEPEIDDIEEVEPIFRDPGQACYVAYLFCSLPASPKSPMFTAREMIADGEIEPAPLSGIRFGARMSPLEIRGECARVIAHVEATIKGVELDAIRAKYAHGQERLDAMVNIRNFMSRQCMMGIAKKAVTMITARNYGNSSTREMLSDKHIARAVGGISRESVGIARRIFKRKIFEIETESLRKLSEVFVCSGVSRL